VNDQQLFVVEKFLPHASSRLFTTARPRQIATTKIFSRLPTSLAAFDEALDIGKL